MDTRDQLRRLTEQRKKRTFVLPPEEIHPALSRGMPATPPTQPLRPLPTENERAGTRLEDLAPGELFDSEVGSCYVVTTTYPVDHSHGPLPLRTLLEQEPAALAPMLPGAHLRGDSSFLQSAVIDTETTGLGGGAGTFAFMVGVGTFEEQRHGDGSTGLHFVVRQLFMRTPADEPALLTVLHRLLEGRSLLLSFNGRSFDVPLLRARYLLNRSFLPGEARLPALFGPEAPHLDLLVPARQLWRRRLHSCRLGNLEQQLLGLTRSEEDVPGALIPEMYMQFQRTGHAGDMRRVFYHNAEDIVSTAAVAAQVCNVLLQAREPDHLDGRDWLSLGASYEKMQRWDDALGAYRYALERIDQPDAQEETFRRLSALCKRTRRWEDAVALWEQWLSTIPSGDATPYIELAKYYEWQAHDAAHAELWASFGLHTVRALPSWKRLPGQLSDLERRLERIIRKRSGGAPETPSAPE
jgi:uncharacterized protein YprB with RNaseH-like and TPR domain